MLRPGNREEIAFTMSFLWCSQPAERIWTTMKELYRSIIRPGIPSD